MNFTYVAGQILLAILFLCSILGSLGGANALLWTWQQENEHVRFGMLTHVGAWLSCVALMAGLIHACILNNWLGMGSVSA